MKKYIVGALLAIAFILLCGEAANNSTLSTAMIKLSGISLLALSGWLFRKWKIGDDRWVKKILDE